MLFVTDLERDVSRYQEILGFGEAAGVSLDLHQAPSGSPDVGHGAVPCFVVSDLDSVVPSLRDRSVDVDDRRCEGGSPRGTRLRDSEGNSLGLTEGAETS